MWILEAASLKACLCLAQTIMGSVKSKEDHGYVMSVGYKTVKGFLALEKAKETRPSGLDQPKSLIVGQSLEMVVTSVNHDTNTVFLDANHASVAKNKVSILPLQWEKLQLILIGGHRQKPRT